ncbi:MAG: PIN domain-containing protein [Lachnospiraceae bacterium]|nr:PIN domain-containing protein [Lachnospiraceae bacterium]
MEDKEFIVVAFAVIDTNVVISSMLGNKRSATKEIFHFIKNGNIIPLYDRRILGEYKEVLERFFTEDISSEKISEIVEHGYLVTDIKETREYFADKTDIPFFEVKESSKELDAYLITGNTKHYPENSTRTAAFVIDVMQYLNRFVLKDKEKYLQDIKERIEHLDSEKYVKAGR